jgi:hypothetical protein
VKLPGVANPERGQAEQAAVITAIEGQAGEPSQGINSCGDGMKTAKKVGLQRWL